MEKIKFNKHEQEIMNGISENGEYVQDMSPLKRDKSEVEKALKSLHWQEMIKRKPTYGNVFIATEMGNIAISHNKAAESLNN